MGGLLSWREVVFGVITNVMPNRAGVQIRCVKICKIAVGVAPAVGDIARFDCPGGGCVMLMAGMNLKL